MLLVVSNTRLAQVKFCTHSALFILIDIHIRTVEIICTSGRIRYDNRLQDVIVRLREAGFRSGGHRRPQ